MNAKTLSNAVSGAAKLQPGRAEGRRWSLRSYLAGLVIAVGLPFVALLTYEIYDRAQFDSIRATDDVTRQALLTARELEQFVSDSRMLLQTISRQLSGRVADRGWCEHLVAIYPSIDTSYDSFALIDGSGTGVCLARPLLPGRRSAPTERDWYKEAMRTGGFVIGAPRVSRVTGRPAVPFAHPILDGRSRPEGVVLLIVGLERLPIFPRFLAPERNAVIRVVDSEGTIIASSADPEKWVGTNVRNFDIVDQVITRKIGTTRAKGIDGTERIFSFAQVDGTDWHVFAGISVDAVYAGARATLRRGGLALTTIVLLVALLSWLLARDILKGVRGIAVTASAAASGGLSARAETGGPREFAAVAAELNRMRTARRRQDQRLLAMSRRLVAFQETERRGLARELHDRVGQNLTVLGINLTRLHGERATPAETRDRIADSLAVLEETGKVISDVLTELKPPMLSNHGLLEALRWHANQFAQRTGIAIEVTGSPVLHFTSEVEMALFRIAQAALNNVAQHARARSVFVRLQAGDGVVRLEVVDDGSGFDTAAGSISGSWGLVAMRERAVAIDGSMCIESTPGRGTRIIVEAPTEP